MKSPGWLSASEAADLRSELLLFQLLVLGQHLCWDVGAVQCTLFRDFAGFESVNIPAGSGARSSRWSCGPTGDRILRQWHRCRGCPRTGLLLTGWRTAPTRGLPRGVQTGRLRPPPNRPPRRYRRKEQFQFRFALRQWVNSQVHCGVLAARHPPNI